MSDYNIDELCKELEQQIAEAPLCEPVDGEFVDECAWSRTGFAIWKRDGDETWCTCKPALKTETVQGEQK